MQLTLNAGGRIAAALSLATAGLLAATGAQAQSSANGKPAGQDTGTVNAYDLPASEPGTMTADSAILFYKEGDGRVQAIEPMLAMTVNGRDGSSYSARFTYDTLTGATPNGAAPWTSNQTFVTPVRQRSESHTGASGGTVVTLPGSGLQVLNYDAAARKLPVDAGFRDQRYALDLGMTKPLTDATKLSLGINGSTETDYQSISGRAGIAQELGGNNTTLSFGVNFEHDISKPHYGTPPPLTQMNGNLKGPSRSKNVLGLIAGVTQVVAPGVVVQANYTFGSLNGYQTDPYKIVSVVDSATGAPQRYLYESRPDKRTRHAAYLGTKVAVGSFVTELSGRYYTDSWGIKAVTAQVSEHVPVGERAYIEPMVRYYHQTAANFFTYYLNGSRPLPQYASADSRLDKFNAITGGISGGYKLTDKLELYGLAEYYKQAEAGTPARLPGNSQLNLFAGTNAISLMTGIKLTF